MADVCLQTAKIRTVKYPLFYASKSLGLMFLLLEVLLSKSTEVACIFSRHAIVHCLYLKKVRFETANLQLITVVAKRYID